MKIEIIKIPEEIVSQAQFLLTDDNYASNKYKREIIRQLIGVCRYCNLPPSYYVIEKHEGIEEIRKRITS